MQNYKTKVNQVGALESQIRTYFLNIFWHIPGFDIYEMKDWLFYTRLTYSIFACIAWSLK